MLLAASVAVTALVPWVPIESVEIVNVAAPEPLSDAVPSGKPSSKVTVPPGVPPKAH